jgi:acyl-lipid omega-6 desaturase (Delta-12 desaturase)
MIGANDAQIDVRALTRDLAQYRQPNHGRSVVEILITIGSFILLWLLACFSLRVGYGFYLLLAVPAAGFLVRLFMTSTIAVTAHSSAIAW